MATDPIPLVLSFNPRPRARGDTWRPSRLPTWRCFNPRPRARGDYDACAHHEKPPNVSIHAPARGATLAISADRAMSSCFNPRPRARGDIPHQITAVSTHCFNPRPRARGDAEAPAIEPAKYLFQSTPPREGRLFFSVILINRRGFNPRPRARGDPIGDYRRVIGEFQSTPPREGRHIRCEDCGEYVAVSIHAPARGATRCHSRPADEVPVSIHAPARGATLLWRTANQ